MKKYKFSLVIIYNAAFIFLFLFFSHLYYQSQIFEKPILKTATTGTNLKGPDLLRLGYFDTDFKVTSFLKSGKKAEGIIRIGFFGDSHTFGSEVASDKNFPALLQKMLGENIEVLNFGNGWYSFAQSYILWQRFLSELELDIIVYGPRGYYPERNQTFNHTQDNYPSYLHSRFIIDENLSLRELYPEGESAKERIIKYYSFIPSPHYWKYDRRAPGFLKAFEYYWGERLTNPFYYSSLSETEENNQLIRLFLKDIATHSPRLIVLSDNYFSNKEDLKAVLKDFPQASFLQISDHLSAGVPFQAQLGHSSVYGNQMIANQVYQHLQDELGLPRLEFSTELVVHFKNNDQLKLNQVEDFERVRLYLNKEEIGFIGGAYQQGTLSEQKQYSNETDFSHNDSLLVLECTGDHIANSLILGLRSAETKTHQQIIKIDQTMRFIKLALSNCHFDEGLNSLMVEADQMDKLPFKRERDGVYFNQEKVFEAVKTTYKLGIQYYQLRPSLKAYKFAVFPDADETLFKFMPNEINSLTLKLEASE